MLGIFRKVARGTLRGLSTTAAVRVGKRRGVILDWKAMGSLEPTTAAVRFRFWVLYYGGYARWRSGLRPSRFLLARSLAALLTGRLRGETFVPSPATLAGVLVSADLPEAA